MFGFDYQVVYVNGLVIVVIIDVVDLFKGWLFGEEVFEGFSIDQGMRWCFVIVFVRVGRVGEDEIVVEL